MCTVQHLMNLQTDGKSYEPSPQNAVLISEHKSDFFPEVWMKQGASPILAHL